MISTCHNCYISPYVKFMELGFCQLPRLFLITIYTGTDEVARRDGRSPWPYHKVSASESFITSPSKPPF